MKQPPRSGPGGQGGQSGRGGGHGSGHGKGGPPGKGGKGGQSGPSRPNRQDKFSKPAPSNKPAKPGNPTGPAKPGRPAGTGKSTQGKPSQGKPAPGKSTQGKPWQGKPASGKPTPGKPSQGKPSQGRPQKGPKPFGNERFGKDLGPVSGKHRPRRPTARPADESDVYDPDGVRLQKVMANAGVASRRVCEEMISAGRVEVDGQLVTELGVRVNPQTVAIHVDGIRVQLNESLTYYIFNKPKGVVSSMEDPEGRPCISDYLKKRTERLFHVGRLDVGTEGLLLLTNDGELANRLTHPSYEVPKTYLVKVRGPMAHGVGAQMRAGIELDDGTATLDSFKLVDSTPGHVLVEVALHSGRNRIVRRMFDAVGHPVERLVRIEIGPIKLGDQRQGTIRALGRQEVGHLLASVGM
ncbi:pseudouridine synthase [Arthrobacter castelli]|uniref:pseudouridine synthase n=1 Tax=Arthrobacter castelli TaxID=271431 RepID=UPI000406DF5F|nr:pseudouridine synthase [Arthrobacter castelli]